MSKHNTPSEAALLAHDLACERGELMYKDPESGLYVMTSYHLARRSRCCASGCRHCPFSKEKQDAAGRPPVPAYPWRERKDVR